MKLKVIIVDDELHGREGLKKLCERYCSDTIEIVDICDSVESAVASIKIYNPDIIFLDIQMPVENGFEILNYFKIISFEIVFTTSYSNFLLDAIKCSALDYLMKPVSRIDLESVISRYNRKVLNNIGTERYQLLKENINSAETPTLQRMIISTTEGFEIIELDSILYFTIEDKQTKVFTLDNNFPISKTLKELDKTLPSSIFIKTAKSYIVNKNHVKRFNSDVNTLDMINGEKAKVSGKWFTYKKLMDAFTK